MKSQHLFLNPPEIFRLIAKSIYVGKLKNNHLFRNQHYILSFLLLVKRETTQKGEWNSQYLDPIKTK